MRIGQRKVNKRHFGFASLSLRIGVDLGVCLLRLLPVGVAVTSDVHLGKATNIPHANNVDGEVAEKIYDLLGLVPKVEYEDDGSYNRGEKLV